MMCILLVGDALLEETEYPGVAQLVGRLVWELEH